MLNMIVCAKIVMDPEAPPSTFRVDAGTQQVVWSTGVTPVINPYDENALEAAARLKERYQGKITTVSLGKNIPKAVIKKSMAVGADDLVLLEDDNFAGLDSFATAFILAAAIKRIAKYDLILTGRMTADTNNGVVGSGIAEILALPSVALARDIELIDGGIRVEQVTSDGYNTIDLPLPALVTVSHELGELRYATIKDITAARKKSFTIWTAEDLNVRSSELMRCKMINLFTPERKSICHMVEGKTPEELGANLALKIREAKLI